MRCPRCQIDLEGFRSEHGVVYRCASCAGESLSMAVVRKRVAQATANAIWRGARGATPAVAASLPCPSCAHPLAQLTLGEDDQALTLDGCERCALVWFDAAELERLPERPRPLPVATRLTPEQAEADVAMQIGAATSQGAFTEPLSQAAVVHERRGPRLWASWKEGPWLALSLAVLLLGLDLVSLAASLSSRAPDRGARGAVLVEDYAFDPSDPFRRGGLTLVSSFFAPPGRPRSTYYTIALLLWAGYLLERRMGRARFLGLLACGHAAALCAYAAADLPRQAGLLGASAGVAALLGWGAVILGRAYMNERRLRGRWWLDWHGAGGVLGPLLTLGFAVWFVFTAIAVLLTPWEDLVRTTANLQGYARTTPAAFVGGFVGLAFGFFTLRRVGTGPSPAADATGGHG